MRIIKVRTFLIFYADRTFSIKKKYMQIPIKISNSNSFCLKFCSPYIFNVKLRCNPKNQAQAMIHAKQIYSQAATFFVEYESSN